MNCTLLSKFVIPKKTSKHSCVLVDADSRLNINVLQDLEVQTIKLQILTNVVAYCVSAMGNSTVIHAVFSPELGMFHVHLHQPFTSTSF